MSYWRNKVIFITGAGSGIGKGLTQELARRGAKLVLSDIHGEAAREVASSCGGEARGIELDVRDAAAVKAAIDGCIEEHGRIDVLFNNAGIGMSGETRDFTVAHFDRIIDVNLRGVIHGITAAYPRMVEQGFGQIVNSASMAGLAAAPFFVPYATTKHAVVGLTVSLRAEAAALGVRVNALCPASVETPILDAPNPADLPRLAWEPNPRDMLAMLAGPACPLEPFVNEALRKLERNRAIIVAPRRARILWFLNRLMPGLVESVGINIVAQIRGNQASTPSAVKAATSAESTAVK